MTGAQALEYSSQGQIREQMAQDWSSSRRPLSVHSRLTPKAGPTNETTQLAPLRLFLDTSLRYPSLPKSDLSNPCSQL